MVALHEGNRGDLSDEVRRLVFGKPDDDKDADEDANGEDPRTGYFDNRRGQKLFKRLWRPPAGQSPRALAFVSHGFSEHLGNYHAVGEALAAENILAFGHDHVGHGFSEGEPAYIDSVDDYVDDLVFHCQLMQERHGKDVPLFMVAHSMGGMVALSAAIAHPHLFAGMVLNGPLIIPGPQYGLVDFRVTSARAVVARTVLSALSWYNPKLILGSVNMDLISRDEEVKRALAMDDKRWDKGCKVGMLLAFLNCLEDNHNLMGGLRVPFLSLHGTDDGLCNALGSRMLRDCGLVDDKEVKEFEGAAHNLYLELPEVRNQALFDTVHWIIKRS